ncbi:MAG TPA: RNA-binding protein, partial [Geobacterales bacterium]|nr:RNA-binding protein [Geobacterales bacterium]
MGRELYVGNIAEMVTSEELIKLFSVVGNVVSVHLITDPETGEFKRCGYVKMGTAEDAREAILTLDGARLRNKLIRVSEARPNPEKVRKPVGYRGKRPMSQGGRASAPRRSSAAPRSSSAEQSPTDERSPMRRRAPAAGRGPGKGRGPAEDRTVTEGGGFRRGRASATGRSTTGERDSEERRAPVAGRGPGGRRTSEGSRGPAESRSSSASRGPGSGRSST